MELPFRKEQDLQGAKKWLRILSTTFLTKTKGERPEKGNKAGGEVRIGESGGCEGKYENQRVSGWLAANKSTRAVVDCVDGVTEKC